MKTALLILFVYLAGAWATIGHNFHEFPQDCLRLHAQSTVYDRQTAAWCIDHAETAAVGSGLIWPLYWFVESARIAFAR